MASGLRAGVAAEEPATVEAEGRRGATAALLDTEAERSGRVGRKVTGLCGLMAALARFACHLAGSLAFFALAPIFCCGIWIGDLWGRLIGRLG